MRTCLRCSWYQRSKKPERALLVEKQQEQPGDEVHALTVTDLGIANAVTHQNIAQAHTKRGIHVNNVVRPGAADVFENVALRFRLL